MNERKRVKPTIINSHRKGRAHKQGKRGCRGHANKIFRKAFWNSLKGSSG